MRVQELTRPAIHMRKKTAKCFTFFENAGTANHHLWSRAYTYVGYKLPTLSVFIHFLSSRDIYNIHTRYKSYGSFAHDQRCALTNILFESKSSVTFMFSLYGHRNSVKTPKRTLRLLDRHQILRLSAYESLSWEVR